MPIPRRFSLGLVLLTATPWALLLAVAGVRLLEEGAAIVALPGAERVSAAAGMTALAAGMLVFMCLVADRLLPRANRTMVLGCELACCVVLFAGVAWLAGSFLRMAVGAS